MLEYVTAYLIQHKSISIPGLGTIYVERIPAQSDFVNRQLLPPAYHLRFDRYFDSPDREFFVYLSARKGMPDYEAIREYNEWAQQLRNEIDNQQEVKLQGLGLLARDESGNIVFESEGALQTYDVVVPSQRIIRTNASHQILVGDKEMTNVEMSGYFQEHVHREKASWWIWALIIAALALVFIFFHYYRHGQDSPFGNQQIIEPG